jgi:hypothetical protein
MCVQPLQQCSPGRRRAVWCTAGVPETAPHARRARGARRAPEPAPQPPRGAAARRSDELDALTHEAAHLAHLPGRSGPRAGLPPTQPRRGAPRRHGRAQRAARHARLRRRGHPRTPLLVARDHPIDTRLARGTRGCRLSTRGGRLSTRGGRLSTGGQVTGGGKLRDAPCSSRGAPC